MYYLQVYLMGGSEAKYGYTSRGKADCNPSLVHKPHVHYVSSHLCLAHQLRLKEGGGGGGVWGTTWLVAPYAHFVDLAREMAWNMQLLVAYRSCMQV